MSKVKSDIKTHISEYQTECPKCKQAFPIKDAEVFTDKNFGEKSLQFYEAELQKLQKYKSEIDAVIAANYDWLTENTRAINAGFILEKLVLTFDSFPFKHEECRPMFDPIDYIVFEGLAQGEVKGISFIDIKTGNAKLTEGQKQIKQTISDKNVKFRTY